MEFIIKTQNKGYFCGWNLFGDMKFVAEKRLAYRMKSAVAENTARKLEKQTECEIIPV